MAHTMLGQRFRICHYKSHDTAGTSRIIFQVHLPIFTSILYIAFKSQSNSTKELIIIRIIPFYIICLLKKASPFLMSPCNFCCSLRDSIRYLFISFVRSFSYSRSGSYYLLFPPLPFFISNSRGRHLTLIKRG